MTTTRRSRSTFMYLLVAVLIGYGGSHFLGSTRSEAGAGRISLSDLQDQINDLQVQVDELAQPATILDKLKQVDGSGSGLDADTLDGLTSEAFLRKGDSAEVCNAAGAGCVRFREGALEVCDGTQWRALAYENP